MNSAEEKAISQILTGIRDASPISDAAERHALWERCWSENNGAPYFGDGPVRVGGQILPANLERHLFEGLRRELFKKYLSGIDEVSEFGCGVGLNLEPLLGSGRKLRGFDWSAAAVKRCTAKGIQAQVFDMFRPDPGV